MRQNMAFKAKSLAFSSSHSKRNPLMRVMTFPPSIPLHWTSLGKVGNWCFPPPPQVPANERGCRSAIKPDESASRICGRGETSTKVKTVSNLKPNALATL